MKRICYIAGPMRKLPQFNFPAFDAARDRLIAAGHGVFSPADMDRSAGVDPLSDVVPNLKDCMRRDVNAILDYCDTIALLPGWERSKGCAVEVALGIFLGLKFIDAITLKEINL